MSEGLRELIPMEAWERALIRVWKKRKVGRERRSIDPLLVVKVAAEIAGVDLGTFGDDPEPGSVIVEVLEARQVGAVGVDFPDSSHGDGISIHIHLLPGATAVGVKASSSAPVEIVFVLANASIYDVAAAATRAVFDEQDGATWSFADENGEGDAPDDEEATLAVWFGFGALREAWAQWPHGGKTSGA